MVIETKYVKPNDIGTYQVSFSLNNWTYYYCSIRTILTFTNDNLDSPNSIITMLNTMKLIEVKKLKLLNKNNSQIILNKNVQETTSYVTFIFY